LSQKAKFEPVAIIGMGCFFPKADNLQAYWSNLREGIDAITDIPRTHWRPEDYFDEDPDKPDHTHARKGGFLSPIDFNPLEFGISPNALEATDTSQLLALVAAKHALEDAGYGQSQNVDRDRVSVILGITGALELVIPLGARLGFPMWEKVLREMGISDPVVQEAVKRIAHGYVEWQESSFPGLLGNVIAGRIANRFDFGGTNCGVDAACAGSLAALHLSCLELATGRSDMVVTGGSDTFNDIFMYMCFGKTKALSPSGDARPFDRDCDGTILGEGVGVLVLKRLADARADRDSIYAVIRGIGTGSDGKGMAIYAPSSKGQKKALERAYDLAGVTPDKVQMVEAHGTGTRVGDKTELDALTDVYRKFRSDGTWCALGSVKSQIGHTKAAAGIAGLMKAVLALHKKVIPPTIKIQHPMKKLESGHLPFYLTNMKKPWSVIDNQTRFAAVSSFGFGGSNFHCVLEESPENISPEPDWDGTVQLFCFSAPDKDSLLDKIRGWNPGSDWNTVSTAASTLIKTFRSDHNTRLIIVAEKGGKSLESLKSGAIKQMEKDKEKSWSLPAGIYFGSGPVPGKLVMLFPGQGAQYPGMMRDLACSFPGFLKTLETADTAFARESGPPDLVNLSDYIYPPTGFEKKAIQSQSVRLRQTQIAQPALGAVSLGAYKVLSWFGISPDMAAGHSYGELTALCAAGVLTEESFFQLSLLRGKLMAAGDGDRGSMAAVRAPLEKIEETIRENNLNLILANRNAPDQGVISGSTKAVQQAVQIFKDQKLSVTLLNVSAAFHTSFVSDAVDPLREHLDTLEFYKSAFPVFSNLTADTYPKKSGKIPHLLSEQLSNPVEFCREIENIYSQGGRTFIEPGPGSRLTGLVSRILSDHTFHTVTLDSSRGKRSGLVDLGRMLAQVAALGYPVELIRWNQGMSESDQDTKPKRATMSVPVCGANYVKPKIEFPSFKNPVEQNSSEKAADRTCHAPASVNPGSASHSSPALEMVQKNLSALQKIQEETARIHKQFLDTQQQAQQSFQALLRQQAQIMGLAPVSPGIETRSEHIMDTPPPAPTRIEPADKAQPPLEPDPPPADEIQEINRSLLKIVVEKTGYPENILEMDMELDSDLGIDSISVFNIQCFA